MSIELTELLAQHDRPGPRYTSYPTADRFVEAFTCEDLGRALDDRRATPQALRSPLSVYVHVPFCESLCYFCACNKVVTRHREQAVHYLDLLEREIDLWCTRLGSRERVTQLHLGGGSPTFLDNAGFERLMGMLHKAFVLGPQAECSIEVDPRTADAARIAFLARMGFNRLSLGVQDFDADVQKAVHRIQPLAMVEECLDAARQAGFASVNVDLIHGLPLQTRASFAATIEQVARLRPERIALYAYAHLPQRFKPQRRIHADQLPGTAERLWMMAHAREALAAAGYDYIGMDHFALQHDALAVARRQGRLHRNFQGYSTQPDCELIGLGVSAISRMGGCYSQSVKTIQAYGDAIAQGCIPVERGVILGRDDHIRRAVIMALMCQGQIDFEAVGSAWLIDFKTYFSPELQALSEDEANGLLTIDNSGIALTPGGWHVVRSVAMRFDRYLQQARPRVTAAVQA